MHRIQFLLCALTMLVASCASTANSGGGSDAAPARVRWIDYRSGYTLELVNEAHTNRLELYSTPSNDPSTKVADNDLMADLVEYLDDEGFFEQSSSGLFPASGNDYWSQAIEFDGASGPVHLAVHKNSPQEVKATFRTCAQAFNQTYNSILALRSVNNPGSQDVFDSRAPKRRP